MCMARLNVYVPDELAAASREKGLNVSALTQRALGQALAERATDEWLEGLTAGRATVSHAEVVATLDDVREELGE